MSDGLTPEQQAAINALDTDVCVAAGAGAGKTRVLVERFLRLTLPGEALRAAVDEVLAITFTRKAALEMKARIARELTARGRGAERRRLEVGYISTIHTFCERVLRENPFEAGLDPEFAVLDDPASALLREQAYEQVLEAAFARDGDPVAELAQVCYDRRTPEGEDGVAALYANAAALLAALASRGYSPEDVVAWADEPLEQYLERSLALLVQQLHPTLRVFRDGLQALALLSLGTKQMEQNRRELVAALPRIGLREEDGNTEGPGVRASLTDRLEAVAEQLALLEELRSLMRANKTKDMDLVQYEAAREQFETMRDAHDTLRKWAGNWSPAREQRAQELARAGVRLVARLWQAYEALKRERAALDFHDLQRLTRDLLRDSPSVCARLRRRLRYLMVDEFQDTDRLQCEILDRLRGRGNLFFVGDAKQSIYRFRNADLQLFLERERALSAGGATPAGFRPAAGDPNADPPGRRLALTVNFRSRPEILTLVNALFGAVWANSELPYEPLVPGRAFDAKELPAVDFLPVADAGSADANRRAEAQEVARRVRALTDGSVRITRVDHPRRGDAVRLGDIVVLLRASTVLHYYEQALEALGIPTFVVGGRDYYARREIRDVVNLLKTIRCPLDDLAVASALRSPFAGISLDTLSLLAIQSRALPDEPRSLYGAIRAARETQPIEETDAQRLEAFATLVERLRDQEDRYTVSHILEIVLAETPYVLEILRRRGGRRTLANVRKLQQMANARPGDSVLDFVERIEDLTRVHEREGNAPTYAESADVVRLMTIHQAKGLEFPVVVLPDLGRAPAPTRHPLLALDPDRRHAACKVWDEAGHDTPLHHVLAAADRAADADESLRLLYVALTRAEEHLVLAGPRPAPAETWAEQVWRHAPGGD